MHVIVVPSESIEVSLCPSRLVHAFNQSTANDLPFSGVGAAKPAPRFYTMPRRRPHLPTESRSVPVLFACTAYERFNGFMGAAGN